MNQENFESYRQQTERRVQLVKLVGSISLGEGSTRADYVLSAIGILIHESFETPTLKEIHSVIGDVVSFKLWDEIQKPSNSNRPIFTSETVTRDITEALAYCNENGLIEDGLALTPVGINRFSHLGHKEQALGIRATYETEKVLNSPVHQRTSDI